MKERKGLKYQLYCLCNQARKSLCDQSRKVAYVADGNLTLCAIHWRCVASDSSRTPPPTPSLFGEERLHDELKERLHRRLLRRRLQKGG